MKYSDLLKTLWVVFAFAAYPIYLKAETSMIRGIKRTLFYLLVMA